MNKILSQKFMTAEYIGQPIEGYVPGKVYELNTHYFTGRIHKPGKGDDGKWLDNEGEKDNRVMVWQKNVVTGNPYLKVFQNDDDVKLNFRKIG